MTLAFRHFEKDHFPLLEKWLNDPELMFKWTAHYLKYPLNKEDFFEHMQKARNEGSIGHLFLIVDPENDDFPYGYIELNPINNFFDSVNICRVLIGEKAYRGKGLAKHMVSSLLQYAFEDLNLHRVELTVNEDNTPAIKAYERAGMRKEVLFRDYLYFDEKYHNLYVMSMLKQEWEALKAQSG